MTAARPPARRTVPRLARRRAVRRRARAALARRAPRHAALRLFAGRDAGGARRLRARPRRPRSPRLLRREGQLRAWRCCRPSPRPAAASTSSRAASSTACSPPAAIRRASSSPASARRAREMRQALDAGVLLLQRRERSRARGAVRGGECARADARAVSLRVNPDVDAGTHPYISTGLKDNKFGIAHDRAVAAYLRAADAAGHRGGRHRLPHRLADHRGGALPRRARPRARPGRGGRGARACGCTTSTSAAASASPTPTRRRRAPRRWSPRCSQRIDARGHGGRRLLFEPGRSLVGNAGVLLAEVLYLKPRRAEELLHRRRGDERPDAPCPLRRLDGDRAVQAARWRPARRPGTWSARSANRATGSAATARWPCGRATCWRCCRPAPTA